MGAFALVLAVTLGAFICASHAVAASSSVVRLRRPLQVAASAPGSAPFEPSAQYPSSALAPGESPLATSAPEPLLVGPVVAGRPAQSNTSRTIVGALSSTSSDTAYCTDSACNLLGPGSCSDATAALNTRLNYIYQSTVSCGLFGALSKYHCCVQTCSTDYDCPSNFFCQGGYANNAKYCYKCDACGTTTVTKCQRDLGCTYPCCLNQYGCAGSTPGNQLSDEANCCPTTPFGPFVYVTGLICTCGAPQTCPSSPPPTPPLSPPPRVPTQSSPPPQSQQYVSSSPPPPLQSRQYVSSSPPPPPSQTAGNGITVRLFLVCAKRQA